MKQRAVSAIGLIVMLGTVASGQTTTLTNPAKTASGDQVARLMIDVPPNATTGDYRVTRDGREVACQLGEADGKNQIWVLASLEPGETSQYVVQKGRPSGVRSLVSIKRQGDVFVLDNGLFAVQVSATAGDGIPAPIQAVRVGGRWVGSGTWQTQRALKRFTATVLGDGPLFAKLRLRYEFEGMAGLYGNVPAFAEVDVTLFASQNHAVIHESHEMDPGDSWEFDCAAGWNARKTICVTHGNMPAHGGAKIPSPTSLDVGQTRMGDTLLSLQPRWTQSYDEGWFFACHDDHDAMGAIPCHAARWHWPHNNLIEVKVRESGDYAGLRCPTWKGRRHWFLIAGRSADWDEKGAKQYVTRHAFQSLDKLHHDYLLDWPGLDKLLTSPGDRNAPKLGSFDGFDFYSSWMNPTSMLRGYGRNLMREPGRQGHLGDLTRAQVFLDPDSYGSYWNFWSPENPNFFTDYNRCGILTVTKLKRHPQFRELARLAEQKFHEDMYHSITLPGGAGQECPGYVAYAMHTWQPLAEICKEHLGFDPTRWPRYRAGVSFLVHLSQPIAPGERRCHPGGDTHPLGPDVFALADEFGVKEDVPRFQTEELPGFGVVFRNRPGTDSETYLAFKSGPNRGHFHGDQLALHYCADARQVAIDHMCSYGPRAGAEHMHNRVAFHTDKLPYANMDGFERVIAMKTSKDVDIAVGQVESERLRVTSEYPPEEWDVSLPEQRFDVPLVYRRTIVCLKNEGRDYFVLRDQHTGPDVKATYCLHVLSDRCDRRENTIDFGNLTVFCAEPSKFDYARHDWDFEKQGRDGSLIIRENTKGIRLTASGSSGQFITVLYPGNQRPAIEAVEGGVRVGDDEILFAGGIDDDRVDDRAADDAATVYVTVKRRGKQIASLSGKDIDMDRSQGEVGLFVPDAGYPFGRIPDWLIKQRAEVPDWAPDWARRVRRYETTSPTN